MRENVKILQILPAAGWHAHFKGEGEPDFVAPLVCFALVEVTDDRGSKTQQVRAMSWCDPYVEFCEDEKNFSRLSHENQSAP